MDQDERRKKVLEEEDYIYSPKFGNSLNKFIQKNNEEAEDHTISKVLLMPAEEVRKLYDEAVEMLKEGMLDE